MPRRDPAAGQGAALWDLTRRRARSLAWSSPPRTALLLFALAITGFATLLMMPWSTASGRSPAFHDALFVAVSAVSVTGLTPLNTAEHWSLPGQLVILMGIQVGGLGILTIASLLALSVTRHVGLRTRLLAQDGVSAGGVGEVRSVIKTVVVCSLSVEGVLALVLVPRLIALEGDVTIGFWHGIFYSVSAFNNAGFVIHPEGLADLGYDPLVLWTLMVGVFLGSLGFPVLLLLWRYRWHFRRFSLHAKITVEVTVILMVLGALLYAAFEWNQSATLNPMNTWEKVQSSLFASVMMRSGGFAVVDVGMERSETLLVTNALMFIGGGSASTAGGIKVTTLAVILLAFLAEARGHTESVAHGRTIPTQALRIAASVVALGASLIVVSTVALMVITGEGLERSLFESVSAFATCGLTTGLTEELPPSGLYVLSALMFAGRVGILTFAAALTVRHNQLRFRYPEERPIIG